MYKTSQKVVGFTAKLFLAVSPKRKMMTHSFAIISGEFNKIINKSMGRLLKKKRHQESGVIWINNSKIMTNSNVKGRGRAWLLEFTRESYGKATFRATVTFSQG